MADLKIQIHKEEISEFCRQHHIKKLAFFGSVLRDDFGPDSDVDILVEFQPGHTPGLSFFSMQEELARILNHKVDLNTLNFLSPYFRKDIQQEMLVEYVQA
jgi:uncharacterized protein